MAIHENRTIVLALRIIQAVFAIIVLGTAAFGMSLSVQRKFIADSSQVAHWWNSYYNDTASSPSQINFLIFCAVWSLLALVYLIIVPMMFAESVLHHKFAILAIEAVTMLFWFAGFIALAVFLPDRGCTGPVCGSARAACVFGAFSW